MKPAERKRMVDQVIGLDKIEELAKWCGEEAKVLERAIVEPGDKPSRLRRNGTRSCSKRPRPPTRNCTGSRASCPFPVVLLWSRRARC